MNFKKNERLVCVHTAYESQEEKLVFPTPDIRSNKPIGIHDQGSGKIAFFQKIITVDIDEREVYIAIPNEISLSLNISLNELNLAREKKVEIKERSSLSEKIFDKDVSVVYDFLEHVQKAIIFSYKAVESFCNASLVDSYIYNKKTSKGIVESYGKKEIERWVSTSEKISLIVPEILKAKSPVGESFWSDFKNLERIRNEIIHSKSSNSYEITEELFSNKITDYIGSGFLLLEYFIDLDPSNQIFPLGFGESQVQTISVPDSHEFLSKID